MTRLTMCDEHGNAYCRCDTGERCQPDDNCTEECIQKRIDLLAEYENTGLSPKEISQLQYMFCCNNVGDFAQLGMAKARIWSECLAEMCNHNMPTPPDRVNELLLAEREGRLLILSEKWTPVSELLPDKYRIVLCALSIGILAIAWNVDKYIWVSPNGGYVANVTHWMPLPEPPEVTTP